MSVITTTNNPGAEQANRPHEKQQQQQQQQQRGIKLVGSVVFELGALLLANQSWIDVRKLPLGGSIVAELFLDHDRTFISNNKKTMLSSSSPRAARFRLQTLQLSPQATTPASTTTTTAAAAAAALAQTGTWLDTRIQVSRLHKGLWVKLEDMNGPIMELDTQWNWPLYIEVYHKKTLVGTCTTQLQDLLEGKSLTLKNGASQSTTGIVQWNLLSPDNEAPRELLAPKEQNYVCVAMDFTSTTRSWHGCPFQSALTKVAAIFATEQMYTPWGFGATIAGQVRPIFQCGTQMHVMGAHGLQHAYQSFRQARVECAPGPKNLDQILLAARKRHILVIISDFHGVPLTKIAKTVPGLRIIFVGVGKRLKLENTTIAKNAVYFHVD